MILQPVMGGARAAYQLLSRFRWGVDLLGIKDGFNTSFTTPEIFMQSGNVEIEVFLNGQKLRLGVINDYTVSESGGSGTGFDTVILAVAPLGYENLTANYLVV